MKFLDPLPRSFYDRSTSKVARDLLGKYLIHSVEGKQMIGKIVETEAYPGPHDLASHSAKGLTPRTRLMFGPPGYSYVYLIYGIHHCMNIVTEGEGKAAAVLLRALEPVQNVQGRTQGPGLLCKAMGIDKSLHGADMLGKDFFVADSGEVEKFKIVKKPRIGVDYAGEWARKLLRFYIEGNPYVSRA